MGLLNVGAIFLIHRVSCMKRAMMDHTVWYLAQYVRRAQELGLITNDKEAEDIQQELDPHREQ